jgi:putative inorganic carbon (HCO3(-)) transporter
MWSVISRIGRVEFRNSLTSLSFRLVIFSIVFVLVSAILSSINNQTSITRNIWGTWGRNNGLLTLVSLWCIAFAYSLLYRCEGFTKKFLRSIELFGIVISLYGIFQYLGYDPISWSQTNQVFSFFGNTNFASAIFAFVAANSLCLILLKDAKSRLVLVFRYFLIAIALFSSFKTESIQGLAAFAICLALFIYIKLDIANLFMKLTYLFIIASVGLLAILGTLGVGPLGQFLRQDTVLLRYQYWLTGIRMGMSEPIWGVGIDSYGDHFRTFRSESLAQTTSIDLVTNNAHNVFVQAFATSGIIGLVALLIPLLFSILVVVRSLLGIRKVEKIDLYIMSIFVGMWATACFSIDNISIAVWNFAFLGLTLGIGSKSELLPPSKSQDRKEFDFVKIFCISISVILFILSWTMSTPDRVMRLSMMATPDNSNSQVTQKGINLLNLAKSNSLQESQYWYLANEALKINRVDIVDLSLERGVRKFPRDFNLLDFKAASLENSNRRKLATEIRRTQIGIEERHPMVWLNFAYDLLDSGKKEEARQAFSQVIRFKEFLSYEQTKQLEVISKQFAP